MYFLFHTRSSIKFVNQLISTSNCFTPTSLSRIKSKLTKNLIIRSCSTPPLAERNFTINYYRTVLKSNKQYHDKMFDIDLEQHPEKYKILDRDLLSELENWASKVKSSDPTVLSRVEEKLSLNEKLSTCNICDIFKVLAFLMNINKECDQEKLLTRFPVEAIDKALLGKSDLDVKEAILMADAFALLIYDLKHNIANVDNLLEYLLTCLHEMEDHQVVYTFYLLSVFKNTHEYDYFDFCSEDKVFSIVKGLSLDEIAIFVHCFGNKRVRCTHEPLQTAIIDKFTAKCSTAHHTTITALCRFIHSFHLYFNFYTSEFGDLQERIIPRVETLDILTTVHVMGLGFSQRVYNENLVAACVNRLKPNLKECLTNHLRKITDIVCTYGYEDDEFMNMLVEEINERSMSKSKLVYAEEMIKFNYDFILNGYFSLDAIAICLKLDNTQKIPEWGKVLNRLLWIDAAVELEISNYDGPRLPAAIKKEFIRAQLKKSVSNPTKQAIRTIRESLKKLYGEKNVVRKIFLPHYPVGYHMVGFDCNLDPISPPEEWIKTENKYDFTYSPDDKNFWVVIQLLSHLDVSKHHCKLLSKQLAVERHLNKLGYIVAQLGFKSWRQAEVPREKLEYLKNCIEIKVREAIRKKKKKDVSW